MDFSHLLKADAVKVLTSVSSKKRLLHEIGAMAHQAHGLNAEHAVEALVEREALGPTGVGNGVALPHARLSSLTDVVGVFLVLEKPVDFSAIDRQPVDIVFALFAPESAGVEHLKALALVSRTLRDSAVRNKLRTNLDASKLYTILSEVDAVKAA